MEHHRPDQRDRDRRRHHRHDEDGAQQAAEREFAMEDQRRRRAEQDRQHHREHGIIEGVPHRLDEARVAGEIDEVLQPDEFLAAADLPILRRHVERKQPGEDDHAGDDQHRGQREQPVARREILRIRGWKRRRARQATGWQGGAGHGACSFRSRRIRWGASPPPCGEGIGVGVVPLGDLEPDEARGLLCRTGRRTLRRTPALRPPPLPLPTRGRGFPRVSLSPARSWPAPARRPPSPSSARPRHRRRRSHWSAPPRRRRGTR